MQIYVTSYFAKQIELLRTHIDNDGRIDYAAMSKILGIKEISVKSNLVDRLKANGILEYFGDSRYKFNEAAYSSIQIREYVQYTIPKHKSDFTKEEDEYIRNIWPAVVEGRVKRTQVARRMGRTKTEVLTRAFQLGVGG